MGPVQFESGPMPSSDRFWQDDNEHLLPLRPEMAGEHPEQFIDGAEGGLRVLALQDCELLAKGEVLHHQAAMGAKNAK